MRARSALRQMGSIPPGGGKPLRKVQEEKKSPRLRGSRRTGGEGLAGASCPGKGPEKTLRPKTRETPRRTCLPKAIPRESLMDVFSTNMPMHQGRCTARKQKKAKGETTQVATLRHSHGRNQPPRRSDVAGRVSDQALRGIAPTDHKHNYCH